MGKRFASNMYIVRAGQNVIALNRMRAMSEIGDSDYFVYFLIYRIIISLFFFLSFFLLVTLSTIIILPDTMNRFDLLCRVYVASIFR